MSRGYIKRNERDWATQLVSWIQSAIDRKSTSFEYVTAETSVRLKSGKTKYPDILLFSDKVAGIIFNGWELKFPDTAVDDPGMLDNALEKAQRIHSDSFVTWNGTKAIIWKINDSRYELTSLSILKAFPAIPTIQTRDDLSDPDKFSFHESILKNQAMDILHVLQQLKEEGQIKPAINVTGSIIDSIKNSSDSVIRQLQQAITQEKGKNPVFRQQFLEWEKREAATLKILEKSSRRTEVVISEQVLAKFTFYNIIGRILFYLTLHENLAGELPPMAPLSAENLKDTLSYYFTKAKAVDYQAIFQPYFTDSLFFSKTTEDILYQLILALTEFDFRILPATVIGNILENLIPKEEKQRFGQYFTPEILADIVAFPVIRSNADHLMDPTSGTGTFLSSFYNILRYHGLAEHSDILDHIWGNDISHLPAILSVINLYKQDVTQTDNFPRVMREDFFTLNPGQEVVFPNPHNHHIKERISLPLFDGIASNFPFIQQEDIPNSLLTSFFKDIFHTGQPAFLRDDDASFKINERSDYYTYCIYNAFRFLKEDGMMSAVTSNAWLGKQYGIQFKRFLLDNFHIKYIVRSTAEHWFKDSFISTVFVVLEKSHRENDTRFVSLHFKLNDRFAGFSEIERLSRIEKLYYEIDHCAETTPGSLWCQDDLFEDRYVNTTEGVEVVMVPRKTLEMTLASGANWAQFFTSAKIFDLFKQKMVSIFPRFVNVFRGERTGWNDMFVLDEEKARNEGIESKYLIPYVKSSNDLSSIEFGSDLHKRLFVCADGPSELLPGAKKWISRFKGARNKNGTKTIEEACSGHKPYWYSLRPKQAHIITAINPYERFFFTFSDRPFTIDQRLIAMTVRPDCSPVLITALLNSSITILSIEMRGTDRNLGVLDLNADYLKDLQVLDPSLLDDKGKDMVLSAFEPLRKRIIGTIQEEVRKEDRIHFDKAVLRAFGFDERLLGGIYNLIVDSVDNRTSMKNRT